MGGLDKGLVGDIEVIQNQIVDVDLLASPTRTIKLGYDIVLAVDAWKRAKTAYREVHRDYEHEYLVESVDTLLAKYYQWPEADVVIGGFPCQDFTKLGKQRGIQGSNGKLSMSMGEAVRRVQPKLFIAENVRGLGERKDDFKAVLAAFESAGYLVKSKLINAKNYGVPQSRERLILIGISKKYATREALELIADDNISLFPEPSHSAKDSQHLEKCIASYEILKHYNDDYVSDDHMPTTLGRYCPSFSSLAKEVDFNRPAATITGKPYYRRIGEVNGGVNEIHLPIRQLSVKECLRLQGFDDDVGLAKLGLAKTPSFKLIGNAVPPILGFHIARHLETMYDYVFDR
jgi:DNA (cytosine-5)-methyltransferase 1